MSRDSSHALDDRIDRVARELTQTASDPALTAAIRARIQQPDSGWAPVAAASALAVLTLMAVTVWQGSGPTHSVSTVALPGNPVTPLAPYAEPTADRPLRGPIVQTVAVVSAQTASTPVLSSVEPLNVVPIEFAALPELEALHVDDLRIAAIDGGDSKEFR